MTDLQSRDKLLQHWPREHTLLGGKGVTYSSGKNLKYYFFKMKIKTGQYLSLLSSFWSGLYGP